MVVKPYLQSKLFKFNLEINPKPQESKTNGTEQLSIKPPPQLPQPK